MIVLYLDEVETQLADTVVQPLVVQWVALGFPFRSLHFMSFHRILVVALGGWVARRLCRSFGLSAS